MDAGVKINLKRKNRSTVFDLGMWGINHWTGNGGRGSETGHLRRHAGKPLGRSVHVWSLQSLEEKTHFEVSVDSGPGDGIACAAAGVRPHKGRTNCRPPHTHPSQAPDVCALSGLAAAAEWARGHPGLEPGHRGGGAAETPKRRGRPRDRGGGTRCGEWQVRGRAPRLSGPSAKNAQKGAEGTIPGAPRGATSQALRRRWRTHKEGRGTSSTVYSAWGP